MDVAFPLAQLATLFVAAFGAATVLPFQSEVVFVALQLSGDIGVGWLIAVASVGNVLGAVVNYVLGRWVTHFRHSGWFPVTGRQLDRAQHWYNRWGVWTLLLSWAPFGDAFTVIAGMMRTPFWLFLLLVSLAKTGRYAALGWATAAAAG